MSKYIKNNKVAVLVSIGFGAGWSTWNDIEPDDSRFAKLIDENRLDDAIKLAEKLNLYSGGLENCRITWLRPGTEYIIEEYDGSESIKFRNSNIWKVA